MALVRRCCRRRSAYYSCLTAFLLLTCSVMQSAHADLTFELPEESDVDYLVGNIAEGMETEGDSNIRYQFASILRPNETYFSLHPLTGDLRTVSIIDREEQCPDQRVNTFCQKTLQVLIRDWEDLDVINVYVNILDINDHTPLFSDNVINLAISESVTPGTPFPMELATDPDVGNNTIQTYRLSDNYDGLFELSVLQYPDGTIVSVQLVVAKNLDRETRPSYAFYLEASDYGIPRKAGNTLLNVTVLDSNDHSPKFEQSQYSVDIPEDWTTGNSILTVKASDSDTGSNGRVIYSFAPSVPTNARALFQIHRDTGVIRTIGRLDFETKPLFQLIIEATNDVTNPIPDFAFVTVNVVDVNDNKPILTVTPLDGEGRQANLSEISPPGTHVAFVTVSDVDTGANGQVSVSLMFHYENFSLVEERPGQYFVKTVSYLDREDIAIFNITVMAQDHGNPSKFSRRKLVVFVEDVNDNYPYFMESPIQASIHENNTPEETVTTILAFDDDEGLNSNLIFSIFGGEEFFFINPITGVLRASVVFDRENISTVSFVVEACDQGDPFLCTNTSMIVTVLDQNDNPPVFGQELYEFHLSENNDIGDVIGSVRATDVDSGENAEISYTIKYPKFQIDSSTGAIHAIEMLDFEEQGSHSFVVTAVDGGHPAKSGTTRVVVTLSDENDNAPRILFPDEEDNIRFIPIRADPGFFVAQIDAYDPDSGQNAMLSYDIESGKQYGYFGISSTGELVTTNSFKGMDELVFNLSIRVSDGGKHPLSNVEKLHIAVADRPFNVSLPASNFTERFNRTIFNFHLAMLPLTDEPVVADWLMVIVISLAGLAVFLLVVFLVLASTRCRRSDKPKGHQYSVPHSNDKLYVASLTRSIASDTSDPAALDHSIVTSHSSIPSKNIMKWRQQAQQHTRRQDALIGHPRMSTFGSHSDISNASMTSRGMTDPDTEVQRLIDKLRLSPTDVISDHSSEGDARSSSRDSGNGGDSDRDTKDVSTSTIHASMAAPSAFSPAQRAPPQHSNNRSTSMPTIPSLGPNRSLPRNFSSTGPRCTPECRTMGHGDHCWLPPGSREMPKSKSVTFSHPVEGEFAMRDRNDNRLGDRTGTPGYPNRAQASSLLDRLRQSPTPSTAESTHSDPGRIPADDPRRPPNAVNLSPIREHPDERRNRKRHSGKRRTPSDPRSSQARGSKLRGNLSSRIRDPGSYPMHNRAPSSDSCEGAGDSSTSVDVLQVRPPAPYLDDTDSDNDYVNTVRGVSSSDDPDSMRDWV